MAPPSAIRLLQKENLSQTNKITFNANVFAWVPHHTTDMAHWGLTSQIGRDAVYSTKLWSNAFAVHYTFNLKIGRLR